MVSSPDADSLFTRCELGKPLLACVGAPIALASHGRGGTRRPYLGTLRTTQRRTRTSARSGTRLPWPTRWTTPSSRSTDMCTVTICGSDDFRQPVRKRERDPNFPVNPPFTRYTTYHPPEVPRSYPSTGKR